MKRVDLLDNPFTGLTGREMQNHMVAAHENNNRKHTENRALKNSYGLFTKESFIYPKKELGQDLTK